MKTRCLQSVQWCLVWGLALLAATPQAWPVTPARLGVQLSGGHANLTLSGDVGSAWTIQFSTNPASAMAWMSLTNVSLVSSPLVVADTTSTATGRRFYRAVSYPGPVLSLQLVGGYPRLSVFGQLGTSWTIQTAAALGTPSAWTAFTNVTLVTSPTVITDTTTPVPGVRFYRAVASQVAPTNFITTNMIWMAAGSFVMGSPSTEVGRLPDETQHAVTMTQGFFVGKYLVTQADYLALTGLYPSYFNGTNGGIDYGTNLSRPVERVSWFGAAYYCTQLTHREQQAGHIPANWAYRLPTESEWEFACRAGTTNRFSFGDDPGYVNLPNYAWYSADSTSMTHPVGQKLPNPAGLFDVHGDVYEWCQDWYGAYPAGPASNPQGPTSGTARVFRGGGYAYSGQYCRSAYRGSTDPSTFYNFLGFRVVLAPTQ
jgi:formylglycine-generating enzyme required for sulfatase activity